MEHLGLFSYHTYCTFYLGPDFYFLKCSFLSFFTSKSTCVSLNTEFSIPYGTYFLSDLSSLIILLLHFWLLNVINYQFRILRKHNKNTFNFIMHTLHIYTLTLKSVNSPHKEWHCLHLIYIPPTFFFFSFRLLDSIQTDRRHTVNTHLIHLRFEMLCDSYKLS